jgi:transcription antitermination factor NusG
MPTRYKDCYKLENPAMNSKRWYVVYSKPHGEERAQFYLRLKGVEHFFPRLLLPKSAQKHRRIVPLFPNYLFVRIRFPEEFQYVLWCQGIKCFVSFNSIPEALDEEVVKFIMQQADAQGVITTRSNLKVNQEVRISGGPFEGLIGIIQQPPNAKGRVKLLLDLLSRQVSAEVPVEYVESGWVVEDRNLSGAGQSQEYLQ